MSETVSTNLVQSRITGIYIPREILPKIETQPGPDEKANRKFYEEGGYQVVAPDGSVICDYPADRVFLKLYSDFVKKLQEVDCFHRLGYFLHQLQKGRGELVVWTEIPINELAVHPFNVRYIPVETIPYDAFSQLESLASFRDFIVPLIVTPVDQRIVYILESIAINAKRRGLDPKDILHGMLYRRVEISGGRLMALEDDEVYDTASYVSGGKANREIKYLIVDGYLRYAAACFVFRKGASSYKRVPTLLCAVLRVKPAENAGIDVLSAAFISKTINLFERDLLMADAPAVRNFMHLYDLSQALVDMGKRLDLPDLTTTGMATLQHPMTFVIQKTGFRLETPKPIDTESSSVEEEEEFEEREERRTERKEEPIVRLADVTQTQRPAVPVQAPVQLPVQPARQGPVQVEAPPRLETDRIISAFLRMYEQMISQLLRTSGSDVTIRFSHRKPSMREIGDGPKGSVVLVPFEDLRVRVGDAGLRVSGYLPMYFRGGGPVKCPNCTTPLVLSPLRCLSCGTLIENKDLLPFPYEFKYKSD